MSGEPEVGKIFKSFFGQMPYGKTSDGSYLAAAILTAVEVFRPRALPAPAPAPPVQVVLDGAQVIESIKRDLAGHVDADVLNKVRVQLATLPWGPV